jgi:hypothetical protein
VVFTGAESLATVFEFDSVAFTLDSGLFKLDTFNAGFSIDSVFFSPSFFGSYKVMSPLISAFFGYRKINKGYQKCKNQSKRKIALILN